MKNEGKVEIKESVEVLLRDEELGKCEVHLCVFTYAGLSSNISAVVERGSKSRCFLTLCLGEVRLPGPALRVFVSYSWQQDSRGNSWL